MPTALQQRLYALAEDQGGYVYRLVQFPPNPVRVHITVPGDVTRHESVPATTPPKTILNCAEAGLAPGLLRQAIADGRRTGRLTGREADALVASLRRR